MAENNPEVRNVRRERASLPLFEASGVNGLDNPRVPTETGAGVLSAQADLETSQGDVRHIAPDKAFARKSDGRNSHAAAASVCNLGRTREAILTLLKRFGGMTDEQIFVRYTWDIREPVVSPSGLRSRRAELVRYGLVKEVGTGKTKAGRACSVWGLA